jgi:hypothetical protein
MESTKVVSLRIPYSEYEKIVLECEIKGITVTEFFERKIAVAGSVNDLKAEFTKQVESAYKFVDSYPEIAKRRLERLLGFIGNF